jgi:hypothetical protein
MGIERFLNHRVSIVRQVAVLDEGDPTYDDYGQPVRSASTIASGVPAGIQPKAAVELAAISQAGAAKATHTIYLLPRDVSAADQVVHDPDACPLTVDLPAGTYQLTGVPDAAGAGHHLELDAFLAGGPVSAYATPVGS